MRRLLKFFLNLVLALTAVAVTLLVVFFLNPEWQKAAVERALEEDTARRWQVESVKILPFSFEAAGLFVLEDPLGAEIRFAQVSGPFWKTPFTGVIEVEEGSISGLAIDLTGLEVGDLTSSDWRSFLDRIRSDKAFWEDRVGLVMSKFPSTGLDLRVRNLRVDGVVLLPGNEQVPVEWLIVEADSRDSSQVRLEALPEVVAGEL